MSEAVRSKPGSLQRRFREASLAVAFAAGLSGMVEAQSGSTWIKGTRLTYSDVLFAPHQNAKRPIADGEWRLCRASDHAKGSRAGGIVSVTGYPLRLGDAGDCKITVRRGVRSASGMDQKEGCGIRFVSIASRYVSVELTPHPFEPVRYDQCLMRVVLFVRGYQGALALKDHELFVPRARSPWLSIAAVPDQVPLFPYFLSLCRRDPATIRTRAEVPTLAQC